MATARYFWHGFIHRGTTFTYRQYSLPLVYQRVHFVDVPYWLPYSTDKFHHLCCTGSLSVVLSLWRRDHNRMGSYRVSTVDVPESRIASGARGPWQQQRCDSLHCYEEWLGSVPTSDSHSPWKHSSILRPHATSILIQECCSSFINMALARTHYPFESQLSIHCNRLIDYYRHWLH